MEDPGSGRQPPRLAWRPLLLAVAIALVTGTAFTATTLFRGPTARPMSTPPLEVSFGPFPPTPPSLSTPPPVFPTKPAPADRALLWFFPRAAQIATEVRLVALDWNAVEVGSLAIPCLAPCSVATSPDGQRLSVGEVPGDGQVLRTFVYDSSGRRLGPGVEAGAQWADDSRHLCAIPGPDRGVTPRPGPAAAELQLVDADSGATRTIATVSVVHSAGGGSFWQLLACSVATDRAILVFYGTDGFRAVKAVELSTGRPLYSREESPPSGVGSFIVNHDASVTFENVNQPLGGVHFYDLATATTRPWPAAAIPPFHVTGISWNGRRAAIVETPTSTEAAIVDVASGRTVWHSSSGPASPIGSRPASDDLLVSLSPSASAPQGRELIVRGDGTQIEIPASYL